MFFGRRKKDKELFQEKIMEQLHILTEESRAQKQLLATLCKDVKQNGTDISRHDMALEDCLDMLEKWEKESAREKEQRQSLEQEREKLLQLFHTYQEQMWNMKAYAKKNDSIWHEQLLLVEKAVQDKLFSNAITVIDKVDCEVNYEFHEVIEIIDTKEMHRDKTVAVIYKPGYLYQGEVRQKAQIAAYQLRND